MSILEIDTNVLPKRQQVAGPGWVLVHRPGLCLGLFAVLLMIIGFAGGVLMEPGYRASLKPLVLQVIQAAGMVLVPVFMLIAAPRKPAAQVVMASIPLMLMIGWMVFLPRADSALVPAFLCLCAAMPFLGNVIGRWVSMLLIIGPVVAVPPLVALASWLLRHDLVARVPLGLLMMLGIGSAMLITTAYGFRLLARLAQGAGQMKASALAMNDTMREVVFGAWVAAGLAAFYIRDMAAYKGGVGLTLSSFALLILCGGAALVGIATYSSWFAQTRNTKMHHALQRQEAIRVLKPLNRRVTPVMYLAGLAIVGILTLSLLLDTPQDALVGPEPNIFSFSRLVFLGLACIAAAFSYRSLRLGAVMMVTFFNADLLATALLSPYLAVDPTNVSDTLPRLFVLLLLAGLVEGWRGQLDSRLRPSVLLRESLAQGVPRYLAGLTLVLASFIAVGVVTHDATALFENNGLAYYASLRLLLEALLALIIAPMAMMLFSYASPKR